MEWLIAGLVLLAAGAAAEYLKTGKFLPLTLTPAGSTPTHQALAAQVAASGVARQAALNLYGYLKVHGTDGTPALAQLVGLFQTQSNTDPNAIDLTGPLPVSGVYDPTTSAALTIYTHDPIPAAGPPAPAPQLTQAQAQNMAVPGQAATSGFNLATYLQAHGNDKSPALQALVKQFQLDVDTDGKYPGPANATGLPTIITTPLQQTGVYDASTAAALAVVAGQTINP